MKVTVKTRASNGSRRESITFENEKSLTQQQFQKEANINSIIKKYKRTGVLGNPFDGQRQPIYGDFANVEDFLLNENNKQEL